MTPGAGEEEQPESSRQHFGDPFGDDGDYISDHVNEDAGEDRTVDSEAEDRAADSEAVSHHIGDESDVSDREKEDRAVNSEAEDVAFIRMIRSVRRKEPRHKRFGRGGVQRNRFDWPVYTANEHEPASSWVRLRAAAMETPSITSIWPGA